MPVPASPLRPAVCILVLLTALALYAMPLRAQGSPGENGAAQAGGDDGLTTIAVMGDSLAYGIWRSMYSQLQRDDRFEIVRWTEAATGLARPDFFDWSRSIDELLTQHPVDVAVMTIGLNDMQALYVDGARSYTLGSGEWDREYRARVERIMDRLQVAGVDLFWVGLPIMRSATYSANLANANRIYAAAAAERQVPFIPLWDVTVDADGTYASHLPDRRGRTRKMRDNDGIHFTIDGNNLITAAVLEAMSPHVPMIETVLAGRRR